MWAGSASMIAPFPTPYLCFVTIATRGMGNESPSLDTITSELVPQWIWDEYPQRMKRLTSRKLTLGPQQKYQEVDYTYQEWSSPSGIALQPYLVKCLFLITCVRTSEWLCCVYSVSWGVREKEAPCYCSSSAWVLAFFGDGNKLGNTTSSRVVPGRRNKQKK